ncbi:MAG: hypothetical protein OXD29_14225 [Roseovarius sp.]|nr:hypothetical protein [Roseovarius sp.]
MTKSTRPAGLPVVGERMNGTSGARYTSGKPAILANHIGSRSASPKRLGQVMTGGLSPDTMEQTPPCLLHTGMPR